MMRTLCVRIAILGALMLALVPAAWAANYVVHVKDPTSERWMRVGPLYPTQQAAQAAADALAEEYWVVYRREDSNRRLYQDGGRKRHAERLKERLEEQDFDNVRLRQKETQVVLIPTPPPPPAPRPKGMSILNRTGIELGVAIYNHNDLIQAIPLARVELKPGRTGVWPGAIERGGIFHVKVFRPGLIGQLLCSRNQVRHDAQITVTQDNNGFALGVR